MGLFFQTFFFSYLYSISNSRDKQPIVEAHTLFEPLSGSLFSVLLDVLKVKFQYGVVAFIVIVILPIHCMILICICSQSCTEYGGQHHSLVAYFTSLGPDLGSKIMT